MYPVSANFHTLAIADSPKTRCRIYFITDAVNCWDDADVQSNGTLLVGAAGDTDSNGRIGQGGVTVTEIFNKDKNLTIGGTVSYQIGMTLVNADGALNNFAFGRCKVYLDVYDDANSVWLPCPLGVFRIELPVKRKVQLITATGYDQMQSLNAIADTWWNGLNFTGGLTIENILNSMVTQLGLHLSATSSTNMVNKTLSFTTPPIDSVERTYRDILGWIAEATGTVAHFNRDGELDMRQYLTPRIGGNNIVIDTDTTGNQCLSIDVAEYSVSQIDALTIKLTTSDQGVTVGSGTNVYTIMDNPFLYGPDVATIQGKLTPIYNRLSAYATYSPVSTRLIYDWSIEAGDIIYILNNSTTYNMPIFQQKLVWRGGYVTSELLSSGDTVRPQVSSSERETYRYNVEMATKVGDNEIISKINQTAEQIQIQASKVNLTGYITATNLATAGQTVINGGNITTGTIDASDVNVTNINASNITSGTISADKIRGGQLSVGGVNDQYGLIKLYDGNGNYSGQITGTQEVLTDSYTFTGSGGTEYDFTRIANILADHFQLRVSDSYGATQSAFFAGSNISERTAGSPHINAAVYMYGKPVGGTTNTESVQLLADEYYGARLSLTDGNGSSVINAGSLSLTDSNGSSVINGAGLTTRKVAANREGIITTDATVTGVLDVQSRRCYASLSRAGWYRVMKISGNIGDWSFAVDFCVTRSYADTDNEVHAVKMLLTYGTAPSFVNENSKSNNLSVTAIRYTVGSNGDRFVDIRYNANSANTVAVDFTVHTSPSQQPYFTAEQLQEVDASPSGETVLPEYEYTFAANTGMRVVHAQSSTSFGDAIATIKDIIGDNNITYGGNAANNLHAGISGFSSGVVSIASSGGPVFFATLGKYSDAYYAAELFTYNYPWRIRIRNVNGTYHAELYYPNY